MRRSFAVWTPLQKWHQALKDIPDKHEIFPESVGQQFRAWQGDKLLGAVAARAIREKTEIRDSGGATVLVAKALSNKFFAEHAPTLLPKDIFPWPPMSKDRCSDKQWGSTLEAAVDRVSDSSHRSAADAISELAQWLLETAARKHGVLHQNPKGHLLDFCERIQSHRVVGSDHDPVRDAIAKEEELHHEIRGSGALDHNPVQETIAKGEEFKNGIRPSARKHAVEEGAETIIVLPVMEHAILPKKCSKVTVDDCRQSKGRETNGKWRLKSLDNFALTLRDGENYKEWWHRGAFRAKDAYRRAIMAPHMFDSIVDVQCWSRQILEHNSDKSHAIFFVLQYQQSSGLEFFVTQVSYGESFTKAQAGPALEVNRQIAEIASD